MNRRQKIKKSLNYSIYDGSFYTMMSSFGDAFFSAFAIFLNATNLQLALVSSIPQTFGSILQIFTSKALKMFNSRKKMVCTFALLQALIHIPLIMIMFMGQYKIRFLIIVISLYWFFAMFSGPVWNSWIGDLVKENARGKYFGKRNKIINAVSFSSFLISGFLLQFITEGWTETAGFIILFSFACLFRIVSFVYLLIQFDPNNKIVEDKENTFIDFIKKAKTTNYGIFVIFLTLMNFSVYICAPFVAPLFLRELSFDYKTYTILIATIILAKIIMMPIWGKLMDEYGTKKVLTLTSFLMPLTPLLLILENNLIYLLAVQIFSGFVWSGFELSSYSFIFDTTEARKRTKYISYYNVINGFFILAGSLFGGFIIKNIVLFGSGFNSVFIISFIFRYVVVFYFISKIQEVRIVKHISYKHLLIKSLKIWPQRSISLYQIYIPMIKRKR